MSWRFLMGMIYHNCSKTRVNCKETLGVDGKTSAMPALPAAARWLASEVGVR